jgi:hypothetical protein
MGFFPLPSHVKRAITLGTLIFNTLLIWGGIQAIFGIGEHENLASMGISLASIFGILNIILIYWFYKRRIG